MQKYKINLEEANVPAYTLPDILKAPGAQKRAASGEEWLKEVRPALLAEFEKLYSKLPPKPASVRFELMESGDNALGGKALRRQFRAHLEDDAGKAYFDILIYIPKNAPSPVPAFLGLNFVGNHTLTDEEEIILSSAWSRNFKYPLISITENKQRAADRGKMASRWPVEKIIDSGYALVAAWYCEIYPDDQTLERGAPESALKIFSKERYGAERKAVMTWAWGMSLMMDCVAKETKIDSSKVLTIGHSRLGKTALVAAAFDDRFAGAISNNSGCMGAALSRRNFGENVARICGTFPHWFPSSLAVWGFKENEMPVDQHQLMACIAPRHVYAASATKDRWADPKGELTSLADTKPLYALFGISDTPGMEAYAVEKPYIGHCGYHLREGKHDLTHYDWEQYLKFADKNFKKKR